MLLTPQHTSTRPRQAQYKQDTTLSPQKCHHVVTGYKSTPYADLLLVIQWCNEPLSPSNLHLLYWQDGVAAEAAPGVAV